MPDADVETVGVVTVPGVAAGPALVLDEPLSFWGGIDAATGEIVDRHHPQVGVVVSGTVLFMPSGRGSSSASSVIAEMVRLGTAPVAFVLCAPDEIVALGALVGEEMYGTVTPVVVRDGSLPVVTGCDVSVDGGRLTIRRPGLPPEI